MQPAQKGFSPSAINVTARPSCYLCDSEGVPLHVGVCDLLFGAPGSWDLKKCTNRRCGLVWLDPMPIAEDLPKLYTDYYTHEVRRYSSTFGRRLYARAAEAYLSHRYHYHQNRAVGVLDWMLGCLLYLHAGRRASADISVMYLPASAGLRVLEIGFGSGETLTRLQGFGWQVEGVDPDPVAVGNALRKGLNVRLGDVSTHRYPSASFDAVVANHVIEHAPDPIAMLRECRRILKDNGRLVVVTPNASSLGHRWYGRYWRGLEPPRHLHIFTRRAVMTAAASAGFTSVDCRPTGRSQGILRESRMLQRYGRIEMSPPSPAERLSLEATELFHSLIRIFSADLGEELVLTAQK